MPPLHHLTYHTHRRISFIVHDAGEQIELRARLRTFDGAYSRTALGMMGYSVLVLKLFDRRFYRIGLSYVILSFLLLIVQWYRRRETLHDFADQYWRESVDVTPPSDVAAGTPGGVDGDGERVWGRDFRTPGWEVLVVTVIVGAVEVALFGLVCVL